MAFRVACIATPLALHVVTARLSSLSTELTLDPQSTTPPSTSASNQKRLDVLVETMKSFFPQYHGVEWIKETARYVANLAQNDTQFLWRGGQVPITDWSQILATHPTWYLRMSWTVDLCIRKGRLPEGHDFPAWFRGQLSTWQEQQSQSTSSGTDSPSTIVPSRNWNCDVDQTTSSVPRLTEFMPLGPPSAEQSNNTRSHGDRYGDGTSAISEDWMSYERLLTGGGSPDVDLGGLDWALFGAMRGQTHNADKTWDEDLWGTL
jgi:hypothetical protein